MEMFEAKKKGYEYIYSSEEVEKKFSIMSHC